MVIKLAAMPADAMAAVMSMAHLFLPAWPFAIKFSTCLPHVWHPINPLHSLLCWIIEMKRPKILHPQLHSRRWLHRNCHFVTTINQIVSTYPLHIWNVASNLSQLKSKRLNNPSLQRPSSRLLVPNEPLISECPSHKRLSSTSSHHCPSLARTNSEKMSGLQRIAMKMYGGERTIRG